MPVAAWDVVPGKALGEEQGANPVPVPSYLLTSKPR